jgi:hypothetical protein
MSSKFTYTLRDYSDEASLATFRGVTITAVNLVAQDLLMDTLKSAIDGVSLMEPANDKRLYEVNNYGSIPSPDTNAQRENKWLVSMVDTAGTALTAEVPGADLTLLANNSDVLDITLSVGLILKNAIEAFHLSIAGNAVIVTGVRFVGRNL